MAILQALFALITKSAGKILNAIFGWAVHALFGRTTSGQQTFLSVLVAAAVAWPLLLVGLVAPKVAALMLAFVPIPHWVPAWSVRLVWLTLALIVPFALGVAISMKAPPTAPRESAVKRLASGFPITLGLAIAFIIMFVSVPVMRFVAMIRKQKSAEVPLAAREGAYHAVAATVVGVLNDHEFELHPASAEWWVSAPMRVLRWFGGNVFGSFVPTELEHFESPHLAVSFYSGGVLLRGAGQRVTWAHGLISEAAAHCDGYQTIATAAQKIELEIRNVWKAYDAEPAAHKNAPRLLERIDEITRELGKLDVEFDEWQALYRQVLQLDRAVRGEAQVLELSKARTEDKAMSRNRESEPGESANVARTETQAAAAMPARSTPTRSTPSRTTPALPPPRIPTGALSVRSSPASLPTVELIKQITQEAGLLVKTQVELAKTELRADVRSELAMAGGLGIAALAGLLTLNLVLVTAVLALASLMPAWAAGLVVTGVTLLVAVCAGVFGWNKRVRSPMALTRQALKDDAHWGKERLA